MTVSDADVARQEVTKYEADIVSQVDLSILQWWKAKCTVLPTFECFGQEVPCSPCSSVLSECVFSLAGHIMNKKRSGLNPKNVDLMIFFQ